MNQLETNIFPITNLSELKTTYRLYHVRGLSTDQEEYDPNTQILTRKLSFAMRSPVAIIVQNGEPYLVLQDDAPEPKSPFPLVRSTAIFEKTDRLLTLDYEHPTPETDSLRIRFLRFAIEGALFNNRKYWRPSAGNPFFERQPVVERDGVCVYRGYAVRLVPVAEGGLGVCVDVQHKYVSNQPLPSNLKRENFHRFKNSRCIYRYGSSWYEIRLQDHTGLSVTEQMIPNGAGKPIPLFQFIMDNAPKPLPREVAELAPYGPAIRYMTGRDETRHAAGTLCYPVIDTSDSRVRRMHRDTILAPHARRQHIHAFVRDYLAQVQFKDMTIRISPTPVTAPKRVFLPPDLAFGNGTVYSVRNTPGTTYVSLEQLGQTRLNALFDRKVGPHGTRSLDPQYIIIPKSVWDSHGQAFLKDLKQTMAELSQELAYDPIPVIYDDHGPKTFVVQGRAILSAVDSKQYEPGFAVAMIHETVDRRNREHDQLAAMVMRELRARELFASVIHTTTGRECYSLPPGAPPGTEYRPRQEKVGKLHGYLRNVALTKILLTNERWPFVLASNLHADLTIAIDVQLHTACFAFIGKSGPDIRTVQTISKQKERLSKTQVRQTLLDVLRQETGLWRRNFVRIVIHRDGRLFATEIAGIKDAIATLKAEGALPGDASLSFVEIPKKSAAPFRLFDIDAYPGGQCRTSNPQIGSCYISTDQDGYVCTTGREFNHPGTANPLHVRYVEGTMPFNDILEDIYAFACLAWTRPEDCSRDPVTIKLADIRLREHAGGYDADALKYDDEAVTEEAEAHE